MVAIIYDSNSASSVRKGKLFVTFAKKQISHKLLQLARVTDGITLCFKDWQTLTREEFKTLDGSNSSKLKADGGCVETVGRHRDLLISHALLDTVLNTRSFQS